MGRRVAGPSRSGKSPVQTYSNKLQTQQAIKCLLPRVQVKSNANHSLQLTMEKLMGSQWNVRKRVEV